jgi:hypothetical protein
MVSWAMAGGVMSVRAMRLANAPPARLLLRADEFLSAPFADGILRFGERPGALGMLYRSLIVSRSTSVASNLSIFSSRI